MILRGLRANCVGVLWGSLRRVAALIAGGAIVPAGLLDRVPNRRRLSVHQYEFRNVGLVADDTALPVDAGRLPSHDDAPIVVEDRAADVITERAALPVEDVRGAIVCLANRFARE